MKETITYRPDSPLAQTRIALPDGRMMIVTDGGVIKRGDIPDDAFDALSKLPAFGGDLDAYRAKLAGKEIPEKNIEAQEQQEDEPINLDIEGQE